ncbi:hypothetical protein D7X33_18330 [Butyricicoccus sp. 1XD8-22]|nr:hypothetical protein D7X33_18330 [Butyricicoccus sp. 1XD8-22]
MFKISTVEAFAGMNETDFKVYDYEGEAIEDWARNNNLLITKQFYLTTDRKNIFLIFTRDDTEEEVLRLTFKNNGIEDV